ncbi:MAG TPA: hypothetical protein VFO40_09890 [Chthoniobacterales bacterium]|nr:hypothetical protein [Chthoniobacterales bacterium]
MQGSQEFNEDDLKYQRSIRRKIIWRLIVYLGGGALVLFLAVLFVTNPGVLSGPMEYLQSLSQGKSAQSPGQANASASPAEKTFNTPEDYLDLMTTDSSQLSKDQFELVQIFNEALNRLTMVDRSEANAKATAGPIILQSTTSAQSKEDFDKIRAAIDSLKTAATRDLNSLQSFEKDLTVPLQGAGIKPPMDAQVASALATRANLPDKIQKANNVIKFADASNAYCDFLEKNRGDWSFKGQGRAFKDRKILDEAIVLGKQFTQSAVDAGFQFSVAEGSASPSPSATP